MATETIIWQNIITNKETKNRNPRQTVWARLYTVIIPHFIFVGVMMMILVDVITASDGFSGRSHRKGGKYEGNENFELHMICLEPEYWTLGSVWLKKMGRPSQFLYLQSSCQYTAWVNNQKNWKAGRSNFWRGRVALHMTFSTNLRKNKITVQQGILKQETKENGEHLTNPQAQKMLKYVDDNRGWWKLSQFQLKYL